MALIIQELVNQLQLEVISGADFLSRPIKSSDVSRPGLELTGYFSYYAYDRIQIFGKKEVAFSEKMTPDERRIIFKKLCTDKTPVFVFARQLAVPSELIAIATERGIPILRSSISTSRLSGVMSNFIESKLAKRTTIHGVLVELYGLGVLIQGYSGIGKSETALELIKKGHRLVADDRVEVYQQDERTAIGEPPKILEHLMEIRGVGIIDVMNLFGAGSVRNYSQISLVVNLEEWTKDKHFDRLGSEPETIFLANVPVSKISVPVSTGRNVSIIIEVAAMNYRAKLMGFDTTKKFEENLTKLIEENSKNVK